MPGHISVPRPLESRYVHWALYIFGAVTTTLAYIRILFLLRRFSSNKGFFRKVFLTQTAVDLFVVLSFGVNAATFEGRFGTDFIISLNGSPVLLLSNISIYYFEYAQAIGILELTVNRMCILHRPLNKVAEKLDRLPWIAIVIFHLGFPLILTAYMWLQPMFIYYVLDGELRYVSYPVYTMTNAIFAVIVTTLVSVACAVMYVFMFWKTKVLRNDATKHIPVVSEMDVMMRFVGFANFLAFLLKTVYFLLVLDANLRQDVSTMPFYKRYVYPFLVLAEAGVNPITLLITNKAIRRRFLRYSQPTAVSPKPEVRNEDPPFAIVM